MTKNYFILLLLSLSLLLMVAIALAKERVYFADFRDPMHYVNVHYQTLIPLGNNVSIDMYVYEFLSNEYRRSFVEMHYRMCDFLLTDNIFGGVFASAIPEVFRKCPLPKAEYHLQNISYPDLPVLKTFPFQKGRVYVNMTVPKTKERLAEIYIDLVIKSRWR